MNKKILITSLFATLMLVLPMTSVVGVSDVSLNRMIERIEDNNTITDTYDNEDCGCEAVDGYDLFRVKLLLVRLEVYINIILLRFGYISKVAEKCQEILDTINSNRQLDYPIICDTLEQISNQLFEIEDKLFELYFEYENNPIIVKIIDVIMVTILWSIVVVIILGVSFCGWYWEP